MATAFIYRLEHEDGKPADPPTFATRREHPWNAGDTIPLGGKRVSEFSASGRQEPGR
jgi:hypothetical protein